MIRRAWWVLLALAAPLAVAGCGASSGPSPSSSSSSPSSSPSSSLPSSSASAGTSAPAGGGMLVQFGREGGLAGISDTLVVGEDGRFTLVRTKPAVRKSGQLTTAELADLRRALESSGFAQLPKVQAAHGADLYTYQVAYGGSQIVAQDGGVVPQLKPVISMLAGLVARYSG